MLTRMATCWSVTNAHWVWHVGVAERATIFVEQTRISGSSTPPGRAVALCGNLVPLTVCATCITATERCKNALLLNSLDGTAGLLGATLSVAVPSTPNGFGMKSKQRPKFQPRLELPFTPFDREPPAPSLKGNRLRIGPNLTSISNRPPPVRVSGGFGGGKFGS